MALSSSLFFWTEYISAMAASFCKYFWFLFILFERFLNNLNFMLIDSRFAKFRFTRCFGPRQRKRRSRRRHSRHLGFYRLASFRPCLLSDKCSCQSCPSWRSWDLVERWLRARMEFLTVKLKSKHVLLWVAPNLAGWWLAFVSEMG